MDKFFEGRVDQIVYAKGTEPLTAAQLRILKFSTYVIDSRFERFVVNLWRSGKPFRCALALLLSRKSPDFLDGLRDYAGTTKIDIY